MSWFKVDDATVTHPKFLQCDLAARGLWVTMGAWSCCHLTDGFLPSFAIELFDRDGSATEQLLAAGLWVKVDGGCRFHDWADYQPSAKSAKARRKARSEAGSKGAAKRWQTPWQTDGKRHGKTMAKPCPDPDPVPDIDPPCSPPAGGTAPKGRVRKRAVPMPADFAPGNAERDLADKLGLDVAAELASFRDWTTAKGKTYRDWHAAFREHLRGEAKRRPPPGARAHAAVKGKPLPSLFDDGPSRTQQICNMADKEREAQQTTEQNAQAARRALEAMG